MGALELWPHEIKQPRGAFSLKYQEGTGINACAHFVIFNCIAFVSPGLFNCLALVSLVYICK